MTFTNSLYRANKILLDISNAIVGMTFDPYRDIIVITGGASGFGKEMVKLFKATGAKIAVLDLVVPEKDTEDHIDGVHYYRCDVSCRAQVILNAKLIKEDLGPPTMLINNAGMAAGKLLLDLSFEEIEKELEVNLLSSFYTIKSFLPDMLEMKRGYIITIGSTLGYMSPVRLSVYGSSKAGLIALHESLTYELGSPTLNPTGVKTLLICPGQMKTRLFDGVKTPSTLLAPELDPRDVAKTVLKCVQIGRRGEIKIPFYGNFIPLFRSAPWPIVEVTRCVSGIDRSMKNFVAKTMDREGEPLSATFTNALTGTAVSIFNSLSPTEDKND
ncbi:unnamed protein product [Ambrosiozyma monospora]|uniref:Unnamed protein product n=1 Tax=Ambrosiozyma monospora TaxID=43982 RepID=A0ACB5TK75_AMBMO|nr:unnamed protein product [Ambrosiozyma monospora]